MHHSEPARLERRLDREPGATVFNLYLPPRIERGDASKAGTWLDLLEYLYPDDVKHILDWLAHRVQRPHEKINHALVLGGQQGIGKDTLLEPVKHAVGPWNFAEVSPVASARALQRHSSNRWCSA